jgi:dihydroorotate dehydrogenase (fumarate)
MKAIGFGFMEGGTVTRGACAGNARPWFYRLPRSRALVVHSGLANRGIPLIMHDLQKTSSPFVDFPLNVSVAPTNDVMICDETLAIDDCLQGLILLEDLAAMQMATINISCPNTSGGEPFTKPDALDRLLTQVDALQLAVPLFLKMPSSLSWRDFSRLLDVAVKHSVSGVTIANLTKDRRLVDRRDALPGAVMGSISGRPTFNQSNQLISKTYRRYGDRLTIIGVGGIFSADDAYTKIRMGASLVALVTGVIYEGPQLIGQINQGLAKRLRQDGFRSITDAIGADVRIRKAPRKRG